MTSRYPLVPLAEVLAPALDEVQVVPTNKYDIAGVYSFGRGLFRRATIAGSETSYRQLLRLHQDQVVISRLKAFEGAIALVDDRMAGHYVSQEFPTFRIRDRRLEPSYVGWLCRWPALWSLLADQSKGLGARRERVHSDQLLSIELPIPTDTNEQQRVALRLDLMSAILKRLDRPLERTIHLLPISLPSVIGSLLDRVAERSPRIGDLVEFVSDVIHPGSDVGRANCFVGLQHVESHTGRRVGQGTIGGELGRKLRFAPGDILYGYLRPYLNKVWLADRHGLCSVEQYVLRPKDPAEGPLIAYGLRTRALLARAIELTHSLQLPRLRSGLLADLEVPLPKRSMRVGTLRRLDAVNDRAIRVLDLATRRQTVASAVLPALLSRAFAGDL